MVVSKHYLSAFDNNYLQTFRYRGGITHVVITKILKQLKKEITTEFNTFKRLYSIVNELLENALIHKQSSNDEIEIYILENDHCFRIVSFNTSDRKEADVLMVSSQNINQLTAEELRERYRSKLLSDNINNKGTIGVGLEVVRMKSKNKIMVSMEELETQNLIVVDARLDKY